MLRQVFKLNKNIPASIVSVPRLSVFSNAGLVYSLTVRKSVKYFGTSHTPQPNNINDKELSKPSVQSLNTLVEDPIVAFEETSILNEQYAEGSTRALKIAISQKAVRQLNKLMKDDKNKNLALKVSVESGGCHGFQYHLNLIDLVKDEIITKDLNNIDFNDLQKSDLIDDEVSIFERQNAKVVMDSASLDILRESRIDYVKELIGTSFKVIDSPYTKSACGCGSSFDVDFSKLNN